MGINRYKKIWYGYDTNNYSFIGRVVYYRVKIGSKWLID